MIAFPNCKINAGLNIIGKRKDNYHEIESVFIPVPLTDVLEIVSAEGSNNEFTATGLPAGDPQNNLCLKAYALLKKEYPQLPFVKMHLHKIIPVGAGLGGGSANAVFTLTLLNELFAAGITPLQLSNIALQLGSDCPFFLRNQPCFATGRGEMLTPIDKDLSAYKLLLVNPGIHINTSWAFSKSPPRMPKKSIKEIINQPLESWRVELINDFEIPVFAYYPEIKQIKDMLYAKGAIYASLSGSGSTVYGIFEQNALVNAAFPAAYFCRVINLK